MRPAPRCEARSRSEWQRQGGRWEEKGSQPVRRPTPAMIGGNVSREEKEGGKGMKKGR